MFCVQFMSCVPLTVNSCKKQEDCFTYIFGKCDSYDKREVCMKYTNGASCTKEGPISHVCEVNGKSHVIYEWTNPNITTARSLIGPPDGPHSCHRCFILTARENKFLFSCQGRLGCRSEILLSFVVIKTSFSDLAGGESNTKKDGFPEGDIICLDSKYEGGETAYFGVKDGNGGSSPDHSKERNQIRKHFLFFLFQPSSVWTSAFRLPVRRLHGVIEGRLSHFLPCWLRTGRQSVISQIKIPWNISPWLGIGPGP